MSANHDSARRPRIGLVLGAGGPIGHAFHAGALAAIEQALGWDPRRADVVVGTSAGAQVAALLRAGLSGADLAARASGDPLREAARDIAQHYVRPCPKTPDPTLRKSAWPASPRFFLHARPRNFRPGRILSALLPAGRVRLDAQAEGLRKVFGEDWPEQETLITAVQLDTGERVAFGSPGAPRIDFGTAVSCSCAVPGVYRPVEWQGMRYVDGGVASGTHLDLLHDSPLDLVIASSPLSMFGPVSSLFAMERRRLERRMPVLTIEPTGAALAAMGRNPMDVARAPTVVSAAFEATQRFLDTAEARARLRDAF